MGYKEDKKIQTMLSHENEKACVCGLCGTAINEVEMMEHGATCVFCVKKVKRPSFLKLLVHLWYDIKIYNENAKLRTMKNGSGQNYFFGAMGGVGMEDIDQARTIKSKKMLYRAVKDIVKEVESGIDYGDFAEGEDND